MVLMTMVVVSWTPATFASEGLPPVAHDGPATEMNSLTMAIAGAVTSGLGTVMLTSGVILFAQAPDCDDSVLETLQCTLQGSGDKAIGSVVSIVGAVHIAVGVPLMVAGLWRVPLDDEADEHALVHDPKLEIGPGSVSLGFRF